MTGKLNKLSKQFTRLCAMALQGPKRQLPSTSSFPGFGEGPGTGPRGGCGRSYLPPAAASGTREEEVKRGAQRVINLPPSEMRSGVGS